MRYCLHLLYQRAVSGFILCLLFFTQPLYAQQPDWSVTLFAARVSPDPIDQTLTLKADFSNNDQFVSLAVQRKVADYQQVDLEVELQAADHSSLEHYLEYTAAILVRWPEMPWDDTVDMSFAIGEGLSYTSKIPAIEAANHDHTNKLLNYLAFELTFASPKQPQLEAVLRLHHRSGVFGLFNDVHGASNSWALGLRYRF